MIFLYPVGSTARMVQEQQLAAHQIYPTRILEGDGQNCIEHISRGGTCGILASRFCTADTRAHVTVGEPFNLSYHILAYSHNVPLSPAVQDLMQIVIEDFPK